MKKSFLLCAMLALGWLAAANTVPENEARAVALNYLRTQGAAGQKLAAQGLVNATASTPYHEFYVFRSTSGNGFVLVAGDDCVSPILGYSSDSHFETEGVPEHVAAWLERYESQIRYCRNAGTKPSGEVVAAWSSLRGGVKSVSALTTNVAPLLTTTWDQMEYYNDKCPYYTPGHRSATGCVATAMAQVAKYWNWPTSGWSSHSYSWSNIGTLSANFASTTYDWANMPNSLSSASTAAEVEAVSTLMYHMGVSVNMKYSSSSGASTGSMGNWETPSAENALKTYFKYKSTVRSIFKDDYPSDTWCAMLRNELDAARPIIFAGYGSAGGHCFVLDGYNTDGLFHINWGWSGHADGYYAMELLNPTSSILFDDRLYAIIGVEPNYNTGNSTTVASASVLGNRWGSVTGSGNNFSTYTDVITLTATANAGCRFVRWDDGCTYNPRTFLATGDAISLTAIFDSLQGDTLGYCSNFWTGYSYGGTYYWGIRLPASVLDPYRKLSKVQVYLYEPGSYTLNIYAGANRNTRLIHTQTIDNVQLSRWNTVELTTPIRVPSGEDLWISYSYSGAERYYACIAQWGGNSDGQFYSSNGTTWGSLGSAGSLMIRGIFTEPIVETHDTTILCIDYVLTLLTNNASLGSCAGAGTFHKGLQEIMAIPAEGARFVRWSDGQTQNPRTVELNSDMVLTAIFEER